MSWAAKFGHFEVCPLCMSKRYIVCADCGGYGGARRVFGHSRDAHTPEVAATPSKAGDLYAYAAGLNAADGSTMDRPLD